MKKVRLFVCADMTVIDVGEDTYRNFHSYNRKEVIANVTSIRVRVLNLFDGTQHKTYDVTTDYINPYRSVCSKFTLTEEHYNAINWVE